MYKQVKKILLILKKIKLTPIIYGSIGVSFYLGNFKKFNDLDLLIEDNWLEKDWPKLVEHLKNYGFTLINQKEHEFENKAKIKIAFAKKSILIKDNICNPDTDIVQKKIDNLAVTTLTKEAFIKAYEFSSKDGYRKEKRGKKDLAIVNALNNNLVQ